MTKTEKVLLVLIILNSAAFGFGIGMLIRMARFFGMINGLMFFD